MKATASTSPASCAVSTTPSLTPSLLPGQGLLGVSPNAPDHPSTHGLSKLSGLTSASTHAKTVIPTPGKGQAGSSGVCPDVKDWSMRQGLSQQWWQEVAHPMQCSEMELPLAFQVALPC